jgi:uncharacterized protein
MALALPKTSAVSGEDIIRELETARYRPDTALRAGAECAGEIAPAVIEVVNLAAASVYLVPKQANLLFWGIHAVAAGRCTELYQPLVRWLRRASDDELDRHLGDADTENLTGILLSVFDGDATPIIDLCLDPTGDGVARCVALEVLARLTFDGAVARSTTIELLTRFEREQLAAPRNFAWVGWQHAVVLLGVEELRERMHATWEDGRNPERELDRDDCDMTLSKARALAPGDASLFEEYHIVAIKDPVAALHWLKPRADNQNEYAAGPLDSDPGALFALRAHEIDWLKGFFAHKYGPSVAALEVADGFFCGVIAAPGTARCPDYLSKFWEAGPLSAVRGVRPFDNSEQQEHVHSLLTRHWNAILRRLETRARHAPLLDRRVEPEGAYWAIGFVSAMSLRGEEWAQLNRDDLLAGLVVALAGLAGRTELLQRKLTDSERWDIVDALPVTLQTTYDRTHGRVDPLARRPLSFYNAGVKIGRNEPCPCGSGKKYKRCCGSPDKLARY